MKIISFNQLKSEAIDSKEPLIINTGTAKPTQAIAFQDGLRISLPSQNKFMCRRCVSG